MKKCLILVVIGLLLLNPAVLAAKSPSDTFVALAINYTGSGFMTAIMNGLEKKFESEGYRFEVASAENDSLVQIQQIENFVSMGADLIIIMAVDPTGLVDVCQRAMDAGVKILAFTKPTENYNIFMGSSDVLIGKQAAEMALDWAESALPAEQAINTALVLFSGNPQAADRSAGMRLIAEMSDRVNVKRIIEVENPTYLNGQAAAENLFQSDSDIHLILAYNSGVASGVNAYAMSPGSLVRDKSQLGVFSVDYDDETGALIMASAANESVFRGTVSLGSLDNTIQEVFDYSLMTLNDDSIVKMDVFAEGVLFTP